MAESAALLMSRASLAGKMGGVSIMMNSYMPRT
jgi:hypothetical protein